MKNCPICDIKTQDLPRYPMAICNSCVDNITDKKNDAIEYFNKDMSGGFKGFYKQTGKEYNSHICFINGIQCYAEEAKFGGIVIQKVLGYQFKI